MFHAIYADQARILDQLFRCLVRSGPGWLIATLATLSFADDPDPAQPKSRSASNLCSLRILDRSISQHVGRWQIDYRVRPDDSIGLTALADEMEMQLSGLVSNSRIPGLDVPSPSRVQLSGGQSVGIGTALVSEGGKDRVCERITLQVWPEDGRDAPPVPTCRGDRERLVLEPLDLTPEQVLRIRVLLEHDHYLAGRYEPLLGRRKLWIQIGRAELVEDDLPLDRLRDTRCAQPIWPEPSNDHLSEEFFVSPPSSLYINAHEPGRQYYRFADVKVRNDTEMDLVFSYLVAPGTVSLPKARLTQYCDGPEHHWRILPEGAVEIPLTERGRWVEIRQRIRTAREATQLCLDFRLSGSSRVGELWIDDVALIPVELRDLNP